VVFFSFFSAGSLLEVLRQYRARKAPGGEDPLIRGLSVPSRSRLKLRKLELGSRTPLYGQLHFANPLRSPEDRKQATWRLQDPRGAAPPALLTWIEAPSHAPSAEAAGRAARGRPQCAVL
jgi:hypothetical protein